jgi:hypothetical protein
MLHSLFKRRIGLILAFAIGIALMLPVAALAADKQPSQHSTRTQTVSCFTTTTTPDGKFKQEDCAPNVGGADFSSSPSDPALRPIRTRSTRIPWIRFWTA